MAIVCVCCYHGEWEGVLSSTTPWELWNQDILGSSALHTSNLPNRKSRGSPNSPSRVTSMSMPGDLSKYWQRYRDIQNTAFLLPQNNPSMWYVQSGPSRRRRGMSSRQSQPWQLLGSLSSAVCSTSEFQLLEWWADYNWGSAFPARIPGDPISKGILQYFALSKEAVLEKSSEDLNKPRDTPLGSIPVLVPCWGPKPMPKPQLLCTPVTNQISETELWVK